MLVSYGRMYVLYLKFTEKLTTPDRCRVRWPISWSNGLGHTIGQAGERSVELYLVRICNRETIKVMHTV